MLTYYWYFSQFVGCKSHGNNNLLLNFRFFATLDHDQLYIYAYTCTQEIHITSCQVCPGGCSAPAPPFPSLPIPCPPIPGEPSCMCQHPNGIIDLRPFASDNGTARYYRSSWIECYTQGQEIKPCFVCTCLIHMQESFWCPQISGSELM